MAAISLGSGSLIFFGLPLFLLMGWLSSSVGLWPVTCAGRERGDESSCFLLEDAFLFEVREALTGAMAVGTRFNVFIMSRLGDLGDGKLGGLGLVAV